MSVRGYDCSCLCSLCEFEVLFCRFTWSLLTIQSSIRQRRPLRLTISPLTTPMARGQVIVPSKATAGLGSPGVRVLHESVSTVALKTVGTVSRSLWLGVGLEAGALAGGVVGTHYLGLGHDAVLLLREGIAM